MQSRYVNIDMVRTGKRIRETMQQRNITVREITQILNVSNQTVYKWLSGQTLPTLDNMYQLSHILDTEIDSLIVPGEIVTFSIPGSTIRETVFWYIA